MPGDTDEPCHAPEELYGYPRGKLAAVTASSTFDATTRTSVAGAKGAPWLAGLTLIILLTPAYFSVGEVLLDPGRVFYMMLTPWLLFHLLSGKMPGGILLADKFVLGHCVWFSFVMLLHHPLQFSIINIPLHLTYILGGYLVARYSIRSFSDLRALILVIVCLVLFFLPFAIYESITTEFVIPNLFTSIGFGTIIDVNYCCRFGIDRAQVVFSHPIHFGYFCSVVVGAFFVAFARDIPSFVRFLICLLMTVACIMSVSSGPLLSIIFQGAVITYWLLSRNMKKPWINLFKVGGLMYLVLEFASTRPAIYAIAERLAFSPGTAFNRRLIFEYGMEQFWRTPILGIGYRRIPTMPLWMKDSVDNHWLMLAIAYGFPAFIAFAGVFFLIYRQIGKNYSDPDPDWVRANFTVAVMLTGLVLVLSTVAVWLGTVSLTFMLLGASGFVFYAQPKKEIAVTVPQVVVRRTVFGDKRAEAAEARREEVLRRTVFGDSRAQAAQRAAGGQTPPASAEPPQTKPGRRTIL